MILINSEVVKPITYHTFDKSRLFIFLSSLIKIKLNNIKHIFISTNSFKNVYKLVKNYCSVDSFLVHIIELCNLPKGSLGLRIRN